MVTLVIGDGAGDNTGGGDHFLDKMINDENLKLNF